jgi:hypothetical protein
MSRAKPVLAVGPDQAAPRYFPSIREAGREGYDRRYVHKVLTLQRESLAGSSLAYARPRDSAFLHARNAAHAAPSLTVNGGSNA